MYSRCLSLTNLVCVFFDPAILISSFNFIAFILVIVEYSHADPSNYSQPMHIIIVVTYVLVCMGKQILSRNAAWLYQGPISPWLYIGLLVISAKKNTDFLPAPDLD